MKIGRFTVEQLSEGLFELYRDGTYRRLDSESGEKPEENDFGEEVSKTLGIDPILIYDDHFTILLDAGIGLGLDHKSNYPEASNILENLAIFERTAEDIDLVILSHLHFDHAAGLTRTNAESKTEAVLPNARILVQEVEWDYAVQSVDAKRGSFGLSFGYQMDDFYRLYSDGLFTMLDCDHEEIIPGIEIIRTGGHTPGHQIVRIADGGEQAYYLGDLVPNELHLNEYRMHAVDYDPVTAEQVKQHYLDKTADEGAHLLFYHSMHNKSGKLKLDADQKFTLQKFYK